MKKVIVIGGGASGMVAAITASKKYDVTLIEKNDKLGKKILITGNGKCNYWNENQLIKNYHSSFIELNRFINLVNKEEVLNFFDSIGVVPYIKNGYYYPMSQQAISINNALIKELNNGKVNIIYDEVVDVEKNNNKFFVKTKNNNYESDYIIISTGGLAAPKTGSTGFGLEIAKKFNHTIIKPLPALVQLKTKENFKSLSGVRLNAKLTLKQKDLIVQEETGEIQFTDYGLSGIALMQVSSKLIRLMDLNVDYSLTINYVYNLSFNKESFKLYLNDLISRLNNRTISEILDQLFNYKFTNYILNKLKIDNKESSLLSINEINSIVNFLTEHKVEIIDNNGFENAQTTSGGVSLTDINYETFESKKVKGMYFTGEVLDVDGACGGYNLGFAWLSGLIAGKIE